MKDGGFLLILPLCIGFHLPVFDSDPLQHLGHQPAELRGPGSSPQISGETGESLHHTPIRPEDTVDLEHLFTSDAGTVAAATHGVTDQRDTDQEDTGQE